MKNALYIFIASVFSVVGISVHAQAIPDDAASAYKNAALVSTSEIVVPTVLEVELPFDNDSNRSVLIVQDGRNIPEPYVVLSKNVEEPFSLEVEDDDPSTVESRLADKKYATFVEYPADPTGQPQEVTIVLRASRPIASSALRIDLPKHVSLPTHVGLKVRIGGGDRIVVSKRRVTSPTILFPEHIAQEWKVTFYHIQPLRISEIGLSPESSEAEIKERVRFLAQPGAPYTVYFNGDRSVELDLPERGNLFDNSGVVRASVSPLPNSLFIPSDKDGDGLPDLSDNCVAVSNPDQTDRDKNGRGDMCDDFDRDGVLNYRDNCPDTPNKAQTDQDYDNIGDLCDESDDRPIEREPWIAWVGIGFVFLVVVFLLVKTVSEQRRR